MKTIRHLLLGILVLSLLCGGAQAAHPDGSCEEEKSKVHEIRKVRSEISLLNLLNGLYLSDDQLDKLISLAERAAEARKQSISRLSKKADLYTKELCDFRNELYSTTGPTPEQKKKILGEEINVEIKPRDKVAAELGNLEDEARTVLTEGQIAIVESFKPCLIPPRNLADPVAVGQASTTEREEQILDVIRRMPDEIYNKRRQVIADTIVRRGEHEKGKVPEDVRSSMEGTYLKKMDEIRSLSGVDFDLKKKELAESFRLFDDDVTYRKGHTRQLGRISRFLLSQDAAEVMKKWREARKNDPAESQLRAVTEADSGDRRKQIEAMVLFRYARLTQALLRERIRSGGLGQDQIRKLGTELQNVRDLKTAEEQFQALEKVADTLNETAVTDTSVDSMFLRIACLSHHKRLPGVFRPHRRRGPRRMDDITGLGAMVEEAKRAANQGNTQEAYKTLAQVVDHLKAFKD